MADVQVFNYNGDKVRTIQKDGEPWFILKDVCNTLNISNQRDVQERLDPDEVGRFDLPHPQNPEKTIEMVCVNESGLYHVILRSDKPEAAPFRRWVTSEVLPSIRKHGGYIAGQEQLTPQELMAKALLVAEKTLADRDSRIKELAEQNEIMKPKSEYFDDLVAWEVSTNFRATAKELGIPERKFIAALLQDGYIYRDKHGHILPKAGKGDGLFVVKEFRNKNSCHGGVQTRILPQSRETFRKLYIEMRMNKVS